MKLLLATDLDFWNADKGSKKRVLQLVSYLVAQRVEVHLFYVARVADYDYSLDQLRGIAERLGLAQVHVASNFVKKSFLSAQKERALSKLSKVVMSRPHRCAERTLGDFYSEEVVNEFQKYLKEVCPDCVLIEYIRLAYLLEGGGSDIKTLLDTHDVMHLRNESFRQAGKSHWLDISMGEEVAVLNKFDAVLAIQNIEKEYFEKILGKKTDVVQVGMDASVEFLPEVTEECLSIGFIGSAGLMNVQGISGFIEKVWPVVKETAKVKVKLCVAGSVCEQLTGMESDTDVVLLGQVADVRDFYRRMAIIVNPVTFGGGLKIKTVEALAYGKPLVTTSVGAEGLQDAINDAFIVADDHDQFISELVRLSESRNRRDNLALSAFRYAECSFSAEAVYGELAAYLGLP